MTLLSVRAACWHPYRRRCASGNVMARVVSSVDTSVEVEFHQFLVQDHDGPDAAVAVEPMPWADNIVVGGVGGLRIYSSATDHSPSVRLELWDDRAPDGLPGW
jgi:hypothetical protein